MFNLSGTELVFIAVLGLIVLGPEKLPGALRRAGKVYREIRSITGNVQREVQKAMDEPMRQVRSLVEEPATEVKKVAKDVNDVFAGKMPHLQPKPPTPPAPHAASAPSEPQISDTASSTDASTTPNALPSNNEPQA